jgi:hypothetical protein
MALDLTAFNYALKEMYNDIVGELNMLDYPTLAMLAKNENFTGSKFVMPTVYANNAGRAGTLTAAQTASNGAKGVRFELTAAKDYGVITIDGETLRASGGGSMSKDQARSFLEARRSEIKSTTEALYQAAAHSLFRDGLGLRGQRTSISTNTVTLTNPHDAIFFEVGMVVGAVASDTTTLRTGTTTVTAVDRGLVTSTVTLASAAAITGFANNDYLYVSGDYGTRMKGFAAWVPSTAPSSTAFFGVDRSVDTSRLGGLRYSEALPIVERLVRAEAFARIQGAKISHYIVHPIQLANLKNALGDKIRYAEQKIGKFSFEAVELQCNYGRVKVIDDPFCQSTIAWGIQENTWKIVSRGAFPGPLDHLGGPPGAFFVQGSADSLEGRYGYYAQLGCEAPGYNINVSLS